MKSVVVGNTLLPMAFANKDDEVGMASEDARNVEKLAKVQLLLQSLVNVPNYRSQDLT